MENHAHSAGGSKSGLAPTVPPTTFLAAGSATENFGGILPVDGQLLRWTDTDISPEPNFFRKIRKAVTVANRNSKSKLGNGRACRRCRGKRVKCDNKYPCKQCLALNLECHVDGRDTCTTVIERPMNQTSKSWLFAGSTSPQSRSPASSISVSGSQLDPPSCMSGTPVSLQQYEPLLVGTGIVVHTTEVANIFFSCPAKLQQILARTAQRRVHELSMVMPQMLQRVSNLNALATPLIKPESPPVGEQLRPLHESNSVAIRAARFTPLGEVAEWRCNNHFAEYMGSHPEEIWARVGSRQCRRPTTQYRLLCRILWELYTVKAEVKTDFLFLRWGRGDGQYRFVRITDRHTSPPEGGPPLTMAGSDVIVSPEMYDRVRATAPQVLNPFLECTRTGCELLAASADIEAFEAEENIANMTRTEEGRRRLE
eukprot:CAMPEP_0181292702 /NCGR_PEP_ID=MMETSP1101-20121128/2657_1 /TAXON_ID=46948 /ORGANISM="Rhodomonas abbreviata, Strain Caron Lab Isolate" /LENGTH=425 /DNA_ID=CAMNT_0023397209 /DNA_START=112 /DNA_END=1386 /DNA_ORIENTATION=-